jgi:hypothetical protein
MDIICDKCDMSGGKANARESNCCAMESIKPEFDRFIVLVLQNLIPIIVLSITGADDKVLLSPHLNSLSYDQTMCMEPTSSNYQINSK